ncbi:short chain dehydrogenase reductase [Immersiella caudata]|uniref:Short chain dehydrogenase reductase n=1 Tax=Immersiella caudata TaxID=314043 RepID=A0AA39WE49_9PEZI|nr:short chain dehydrogenase reductase [Immersiella caudata]
MAQDFNPKAWAFTPTTHHDTYPFINPESTTDLIGTSILITGANKGIGRAAAISYARAGATPIILASRTGSPDTVTAALAAAVSANRPPPTIIETTIDVTSQTSVDGALAQIRKAIPHLDILINNSGFMGPEANLLDQPADEYINTIEVNFIGTYRVTKAFLPLMLVEGGLKTVVFLGTIGALGVVCSNAYTASKLAVWRFCQFLLLQHGEQGVNAIYYHPGGVATELAQNLPGVYRALLHDTPELAADTMVWLTRGRREWLNGRFVNANWDMGELEGRKGEIVEQDLLRLKCDFGV